MNINPDAGKLSRIVETEAVDKQPVSDERLRYLFASAAAGIGIAHLDGRYIQANAAYCAMLGYSEEQLLTMNYLELTHPDDRAACEAMIQQMAMGGSDGFVIEKRYLKRTGGAVWVWASVSLVPESLNEPASLVAVTRDITEQKIMEEKLRERESLLRIASRVARLGGWAVEVPSGRVILSDEVCALHEVEPGFSPTVEEAINFYAPEWRAVIAMAFDRCLREGTPFDLELELITAKGRRRWIQSIGEAERDANGAITLVHGAFQDIDEKKQGEADLRELAARLTNTLESITDAFFTIDREWRFTYMNSEAEHLLLRSRTELLGCSIWDEFSPAVDSPFHVEYHRAVRENVTVFFEEYYPPLNKWFDVRAFPSTDGLSVYFRDVTDLRAAREALQRSEERFQIIARATNDAIRDWDMVNDRAWWNEGVEALFGYSRAELETEAGSWINHIHPDDREHITRKTAVAIEHGADSWAEEYRFLRKDGSTAYVLDRGFLIRNQKGEAVRMVGSMVDLTQRKQAEDQARERAALLDKAQDAIMVRDLDHRITYWNHSAERIYGWRADEVLGHQVQALLHPDKASFQRAYAQLLATGEWIGEVAKVARDGRELLIEARWTLVRDDTGRPLAVLDINTDITERKKLEKQFLRAQRMESIGTLAGGIAHDLNNVLAPILLSLEMLKQQERSPRELRLLNILETSAQKGAAMVRQVLTFARGMDGERTIVQIEDVIRDLETLMRDTFDRNIRILSNLPDTLWSVLGDPTQLHQLLLNLCVNARDAMPEGGDLKLSAANIIVDAQYISMNPEAKPGQYVVIRVADSGTGIPEAIRDRIFDPFFTTKEVGRGTGLGLATVLAVAKSHGGFVNVYSEDGRGTEFRVYLPSFVGEQDAAQIAAHTQLQRGHGEVVLVVDDEESVRVITQQTLEAFGYRVLLAEDGADALAIYIQHRAKIALVLTDMMMPVMDGFATIRALYKIDPDVKIIAASGLSANGMTSKAAAAGVKHFLPKPYTANEMLTLVSDILAGPAGNAG